MDVQLPGADGITATERITVPRRPTTGPRVIVLTTFELDDYVFRSLRAGASGFLLKRARAEDLTDAVRSVASGNALPAPVLTRRLIERFAVGVDRTRAPPCRRSPTASAKCCADRRRPLQPGDRAPTSRSRSTP